MVESWTSKMTRWVFNYIPAYVGTGGKVTYVSHDWKTVKLKLPLIWRTRNYVGTIFGGSLYGAVDPVYMIMLIKILGPEYVVWDKAANIQFKKPGKTTLFATFHLSDEEIETIKQLTETELSIDRVYRVDLVDKEGVVHVTVDKTLYIKRKRANDR